VKIGHKPHAQSVKPFWQAMDGYVYSLKSKPVRFKDYGVSQSGTYATPYQPIDKLPPDYFLRFQLSLSSCESTTIRKAGDLTGKLPFKRGAILNRHFPCRAAKHCQTAEPLPYGQGASIAAEKAKALQCFQRFTCNRCLGGICMARINPAGVFLP
jgi:hypothetical protein